MTPSSVAKEDLLFLLPFVSLVTRIPFFTSPSPSSLSAFPRRCSFPSHSRSCSRPAAFASLSPGSSELHRLWSHFNRFVRLLNDEIRLEDESPLIAEDNGAPINGVAEYERPKKVLILMSDTGGGHRASAEAIRAAFNQEFGDEYQVFVTDLWTEHTPWPFNQLPRSYNFLVKHGALWKMTYYGTAPRLVHQPHFAATSTFIARLECFLVFIFPTPCFTSETKEDTEGDNQRFMPN
ncbi:probable monogalactosyldiacylglycerol synthase 1, chloroplastic [Zingiber officinale]|uniref:probable monogalactosyldiacylglycerol synthase 1, chloroplastic n=1 Tax=Zingiber officinale TaxID=94328 RepID=UPI001C4DC40D|nr:probable monogalactosyldiacylglycerol synthase 1, chloroplastic [Zingiber officinale]